MTITSEDVNPRKEEEPVVKPQKRVRKTEPVAPRKTELTEALNAYENAVLKATGGKILLKMERDNVSFVTDAGVKFTREQPFQLVDADEVDLLIRQNFRKAYPEEVKEFYER